MQPDVSECELQLVINPVNLFMFLCSTHLQKGLQIF